MLFLIWLYQKVAIINYAVRLSVSLHHRLFKPKTQPCPHAAKPGRCSSHFAQQARTMGSIAAASSALSAMSMCGPGIDGSFCDKIIRVGVAGGTHCVPKK